MSKVEIIVKIEDAAADKISEIARECERAGMQVEQKMKAVGMISGAIEKANIGKIERIKGVSYVEESKPLSF
jgi:predicted transcriptional regulator